MATIDDIRLAFQNILQRSGTEVSDAEINSYVSAINSGALTLAQARAALINSPEGQDVQDVVRLYQTVFGRVPDQAGLNFQVDALRGPANELNLAEGFAASPEFAARFGGNEVNTAFINAVYQQVLGRAPAASEVQFYLDSGFSAGRIALAFSESPEFRTAVNPAVVSFLDAAGQGTAVYTGSLGGNLNPGGTFTLTAAIDALTGTAGNDTFRGDNTTVQTSDTINGGEGRDTFTYTDASAGGVNPTLTTNSVEVINVRNVNGSAGAPGTAETATVTFGALGNGETVTVAGRTITAGGSGATASEVQQAFVNGGTVGGATSGGQALTAPFSVATGPAANSVVFTAGTVGNQTDLALSGTGAGTSTIAINQGTAATSGASVANTVNASNFVGATDFNSVTSTADVIVNNLVQGQSVGVTGNGLVANGALTANFGAAATQTIVNVAGGTTGANGVELNGTGLTTVTINSTGAANTLGTIDVDAAKTININAATALTAAIATAGATSTLNISGAGKVTLGTLDGDITTVNAAGSSGGVSTTTASTTDLKFTGGTGADRVAFGATFDSKDVVDGGAGRDTVALAGIDFTAGAAADSLKGINALTNVEVLEFTGAGAVTISGGTTAASFTNSTVDQLIFNTTGAGVDTVELAGARLYSFGADNTGAATFNSAIGQNTLNLSFIGDSTTGGNAADVSTLTANGATTINIASTGSTTAANTITTLTAAANSTVNITGSQALTIGQSTNGVVLDGTAATGKLTITGSTTADIIRGGSGNDVITGGGGSDTLTGGAGNDQFKFTAGADSTVASIDTITDLNLGTNSAAGVVDTLFFNNGNGTKSVVTLTAAQQATVTGAADLTAAATAVAAVAGTDGATAQFTFGSDTYIFHNADGNGTYNAGTDFIVKVTGVTGTLDVSDIVIS